MSGINIGCGATPILLRDWVNFDAIRQEYRTPWSREVPGLVIGDCRELPFESLTFDLAVASHVLEHMSFPLMALREWQRVLRPRGCLLLAVPDARRKAEWLGVHLACLERATEEAKEFEKHRIDFIPSSLMALFDECGGWSSVEEIDPVLFWELPGKSWDLQICVKAVKA